jgi:hypothetical protein
MDFSNGEFAENIARVDNLLAASKQLSSASGQPAPIADDVLRAAVVFLHASLEEVIRSLYIHRLPNASPDKLDLIPLAGHEDQRRPSKILLGSLTRFRGQFVDNVIVKSIDAYLDSFSLNNANQLASCLELAEVDIAELNKHFPQLDSLMKRRHQIVHQMDRTNELDPLTVPLSALSLQTVEDWKATLQAFVQDLFDSCERLPPSKPANG